MSDERNQQISSPTEEGVREYGVTPKGVWLDNQDSNGKLLRRFEAQLRMAENYNNLSIIDLGCGPGLALYYLEDRFRGRISDYLGIDVSRKLIEYARRLWPKYNFEIRDIVTRPLKEISFDFVMINGIFTARYTLSFEDMEIFTKEILIAAWRSARVALSFNVMSPHVDWTRDDLFHWPMDSAAGFCIRNLSRHVNVIADYGLHEYTVQVFREPHAIAGGPPAGWDRG
jgi:SAM-dependent methyltransferase